MFTFALVNVVDGYAYGPVAYPRRHWRPGELLPPGTLRVVKSIEPVTDGGLPILVVEPLDELDDLD
jgi:hypothetical protein